MRYAPALRGAAAPTGEVDGQPITAAHLREFLSHLDAYGVRPPPGGSLSVAFPDATGALVGTLTYGELRHLARRGRLQGRVAG